MITRRTLILTFAATTFLGGTSALPALAAPKHSDALAMLDTDNDGTVDLAEAKKAASAVFDKLEKDNDGTLDKRELARRFSAKELAAADPDHDGTLSKEEYPKNSGEYQNRVKGVKKAGAAVSSGGLL